MSAAIQPTPKTSAERWQPITPLVQAPRDQLELAIKRRKVLLSFLERRDYFESISQAEFESLGSAAYRTVFGHSLTGSGFRKLWQRTIDRDRGHNDWTRLEIYLDDKPVASSSQPGETERQFLLEPLSTAIRPIIDRVHQERTSKDKLVKLSKREKQFIWSAAFDHLNTLAAPGSKNRESAKAAIRKVLWSIFPKMLAGTHEALHRNFNLKIAALESAGGKPSAIEDRRATHSGWRRGPAIADRAQKAILGQSVLNRGGRVAQGWRDYLNGDIPVVTPQTEILDYYRRDTADKSYVPPSVRNAVRHKAAAMESLHHGTHQFGQTAHLLMDDSKLWSGDVWSTDDVTLPVYWLYWLNGRCYLMRGQCLLTVDRRSRRILGVCLIPETSYDSIRILNHVVRTSDDHGLPQFLEWERGIWEKAKLLKGDVNADLVPPGEAELGLKEFGVKFIHRKSAKGKIVERVIGAIQDLMEGEPGYCGRNEQTERFESFVRLKADVEAGRVDPSGKLYTFEQWNARLLEICVEYNSTPHGRGTFLDGLSPDQAYEKFQNPDDPPIKLDASSRYLFATHRRAARVTSNGIPFNIGARKFIYRGNRSGEFIGQKILLWFNAESPDISYVTDLKRQNPFAVERVIPLHPVAEAPEKLADEMRKLREHQAPIRALYHSLKTEFKQSFRRNLVSPEVAETGRAFDQAANEIKETRDKVQSINRLAERNGIELPSQIKNPDRVRAAVESEIEWHKKQSGGVKAAVTPKNYILKPSAAAVPTVGLYWSLWAKIEKANPGLNRNTITRDALGCHLMPNDMTPEQLSKMVATFSEILRDLSETTV